MFCLKSSLPHRQPDKKMGWSGGQVRKTNFSSINSWSCCCNFRSEAKIPAGCQRQLSTQQGHPHTVPVSMDEWPDGFEWQLFSPSCSLNSTVGKADKDCIASSSVCCLRHQAETPGGASLNNTVSQPLCRPWRGLKKKEKAHTLPIYHFWPIQNL